MSVAYLDTSAVVKLIRAEPETPALMTFLAAWPAHASSILARIEVGRVLLRDPAGAALGERVAGLLAGVGLLNLGQDAVRLAETLPPVAMRGLDAIHLASARLLGADLGILVTYDRRMLEAGRQAGLGVVSP